MRLKILLTHKQRMNLSDQERRCFLCKELKINPSFCGESWVECCPREAAAREGRPAAQDHAWVTSQVLGISVWKAEALQINYKYPNRGDASSGPVISFKATFQDINSEFIFR